MMDYNSANSEARELSAEEVEMTSGVSIVSWLRHLFGDDGQPSHGLSNQPADHPQ